MRHPFHQGLRRRRLLALALIALSLLVRPVLAANCEVADLGLAWGSVQGTTAQASDGHAGYDCCPGQLCGECCPAAVALPAAAGPAFVAPAAVHQPVPVLTEFGPAPARDVIRPPIPV